LFGALSKISLPKSHILVSFDVVSLFTNVPLDLALNGIKNKWNYIERFTKIPKDEFILIIKFALSSTFFMFNDVIYKQTYGTPMSSPLSPIIADLVMQDLEVHILNSLNSSLSIYRYVDDILLAAHENDIKHIFNKFNNYHDRLKFTIEYEKNHCLSFLDLNQNRKKEDCH